MKMINRPLLIVLLSMLSTLTLAQDQVPAYPTIPPSYEVIRPGKLISKAQVTFPSYIIRNTTGYKVTSPEGNEYVVDNIVQPKCAFYATYIATNDDGYLGMSKTTPVVSNVYIGEVNFDKCQ